MGQGKGSDSVPYTIICDGCKEDGEVFLDGETEVRNFGNWMRKERKER